METARNTEKAATKNLTAIERKSDLELVITRTINGPARIVFQAWAKPELFAKWWLPQSFGISLVSCDWDVRTGGAYRLVMQIGDQPPMAFFGKFLEVIPNVRIVWTNDEAGDAGPVATVTFEDQGDQTRLVIHELYPSKEALDAALASGEKSGMEESFSQLDALLVSQSAA
jgi:uncharacterized protein YndB with AHSA1/START domain